jgi:DNA polymerase elongation subunit (family B)
MDNPVACVDYSSLYPSSMISQNYSHDSKVWSKEYDLQGNIYNEEYLDLPSFRNGDDAFKKEEILARKELKEQTKEFIANIQSIKTNNWANTNIVDKIAFLKESALKNNLEERVIEVALEAVKEANTGVSK